VPQEKVDSRAASGPAVGIAMSLGPALRTEAGGISAGVAITVKKHIGMSDPPHNPVPTQWRERIKVAWIGGLVDGGVYCISAYLFTAEGLTQANLQIIAAIVDVT
jgi:hypothetical protein